jgi:histidinol-phosphate aminotransferase
VEDTLMRGPPIRARAHLYHIAPAAHGAIQDAELGALGLRREVVIDFSVNTNPLGPPPGTLGVLHGLDLSRYPDPECRELRAALARLHGVEPEWILPGNGSSELIFLTAQAFLTPGACVVVQGPTYGEYARAARGAGAQVVECRAPEASGFAPDIGRLIETAQRQRAVLLFLCNPNNPTGVLLNRASLEALVTACPATLLVLDEAYLSLVTDAARDAASLAGDRRVLVLRSLTKDVALAGLRLGYAVGHPALLAPLRALQPPWSVNIAAQAAGLAALRDPAWLDAARQEIERGKHLLAEGLRQLGWRVYPGAASFLLVSVAPALASDVRRALLEHGCCVRDCSSFGLPQHIRVGVRTEAECRRLIEAAARVVHRT